MLIFFLFFDSHKAWQMVESRELLDLPNFNLSFIYNISMNKYMEDRDMLLLLKSSAGSIFSPD